jgi:hypothetical protein
MVSENGPDEIGDNFEEDEFDPEKLMEGLVSTEAE